MAYILTKGKYNIARNYISDTRAYDFVGEIQRVWGGRLVPTCPLTFDTLEEIQYHQKVTKRENWQITEYDPCLNSIVL